MSIIEKMRSILLERAEDVIQISESTFAIRGEKGGDPLAPIVTCYSSNGVEELRLYNDPNEEYLKINPTDEIKELQLFAGDVDDEELEYIGSWSVINGVICN